MKGILLQLRFTESVVWNFLFACSKTRQLPDIKRTNNNARIDQICLLNEIAMALFTESEFKAYNETKVSSLIQNSKEMNMHPM